MSKVYEIYTDGAFDYEHRIGSYAFCVFEKIDQKLKLVHAESNLVNNGTCNRAEYVAFIKACEYAIENLLFDRVIVKSDSELLVKTWNYWMESWLRKNKLHKKKNVDLVLRLIQLKEQLKGSITLMWIKGHSGIMGNEIVDKLAENAVKKEKLKRKNACRSINAWG